MNVKWVVQMNLLIFKTIFDFFLHALSPLSSAAVFFAFFFLLLTHHHTPKCDSFCMLVRAFTFSLICIITRHGGWRSKKNLARFAIIAHKL